MLSGEVFLVSPCSTTGMQYQVMGQYKTGAHQVEFVSQYISGRRGKTPEQGCGDAAIEVFPCPSGCFAKGTFFPFDPQKVSPS